MSATVEITNDIALIRMDDGKANAINFEMLNSLNSTADGALPTPMNVMMGFMRLFSPYQLNPFDLNPLRDVVRAQFDFERLRRECPLKLFIAATTVRTGKVRLFHTAELSDAALLASACLPTLHHAVEIDGEHYWDGGFTANPAIYPLLYECTTPDILMVLLNPLQLDEAPRSAEDISARSIELGFSTTFLREMRMIAHARQHIAETAGWMPLGRLERKLVGQRFHLIEAHELAEAGRASKLNAAGSFLTRGQFDGVERRVAFRRLVGTASEMVVVYGVPTDVVLSEWYRRLPAIGVAALPRGAQVDDIVYTIALTAIQAANRPLDV